MQKDNAGLKTYMSNETSVQHEIFFTTARHTTTDLSYDVSTIRFSTGYKIEEDPLLQGTVNMLPFSIHAKLDHFGWKIPL